MKRFKYYHWLAFSILLSCSSEEETRTFSFSLSDGEWTELEFEDYEEEPDTILLALDSAVLLNPTDPNVYIQRAHYLEDASYPPRDALRDYDKAIALDPKNITVHFDRAIFLESLNRIESALDAYLEILEIYPKNADALNNLGGIIMAMATWNSQESVDLLKDKLGVAIKNKPSESQPELLRNEIYDIAILYYNKALKVNPKLGIAMGNAALCMYYQGKKELACKTWRKAEKLGDDSAYGYISGICE